MSPRGKYSPPSRHFKPLDGLRGCAILLVVFVHTFHYKGSSYLGQGVEIAARAGWIGVNLFFVLSGFLITGILLDTRDQKNYLRDFFARRFLRIFPLYFGFLGLYFFVAPHVRSFSDLLPQVQSGERLYFWTYIANMAGWLSGHSLNAPPLDPLWSLSVEEQVYVAWPFLIWLLPRYRLTAALFGIGLLSSAWRIWAGATSQPLEILYLWTPGNVEPFVMGAVVALLMRDAPDTLRAWARPLALAAGIFLSGMLVGQGHFNFFQAPFLILTVGSDSLSLFFAATIGVLVTSDEQFVPNQILANSWLRLIGKYSYAIYIFHVSCNTLLASFVFSTPAEFFEDTNFVRSLSFTGEVLGCSLLAACASWYLWESQFLRLKKYFPLSGGAIRPSG